MAGGISTLFLENHYFLADANVLIDLVQVDGLSILTKLGQVEVLDIVLAEFREFGGYGGDIGIL